MEDSKVGTTSRNKERPRVRRGPLDGPDGNVYQASGLAAQTLKTLGMRAKAVEMQQRIMVAKSNDEAEAIMAEYVEWVQ